jgi:putative ABC transport system permease protein
MIGPIMRSLGRRQAAVALLILEVGFGFAVSVQAFVLASWFAEKARASSGIDPDLFQVMVDRPDEATDRQRGDDLEALGAIPGVAAASTALHIPMTRVLRLQAVEARGEAGSRWSLGWILDGQPETAIAVGVRFLEGRNLTADDRDGLVVTAPLAKALFDGSAVGRSVWLRGRSHPYRIVGVTADLRANSPFSTHSDHALFIPDPIPLARQSSYLVRAQTGRMDAVRGAVAPALVRSATGGVVRTTSILELRARSDQSARGGTIIFDFMVVLSILVTVLGTLAMSSFLVAERTKQIGTRRALGARKHDIVHYLLLENWLVSTLGILLGLPLTYILYWLVSRQLPGVSLDWPPVVLGMLVFWLAGLLAALVPALRATEVSPSVASKTI